MEGYGIYLLKEKNVITEEIWIKDNIVYDKYFFQMMKFLRMK